MQPNIVHFCVISSDPTASSLPSPVPPLTPASPHPTPFPPPLRVTVSETAARGGAWSPIPGIDSSARPHRESRASGRLDDRREGLPPRHGDAEKGNHRGLLRWKRINPQ